MVQALCWSSAGKCLGMDSDTISHVNPDPKLTEIPRSLSVSSVAIRSGLLSMTKLILVQFGFRHSKQCLCCYASKCDPNRWGRSGKQTGACIVPVNIHSKSASWKGPKFIVLLLSFPIHWPDWIKKCCMELCVTCLALRVQLYSLAGFQLFSEKAVEEGNVYFWYFSEVEMTERGKIKAGPGGQGLQGKRNGENLICFLVEKAIKGLGKKRAILLISQRQKMKAAYSMNITPQLSMQSRLLMPASQFDPELWLKKIVIPKCSNKKEVRKKLVLWLKSTQLWSNL